MDPNYASAVAGTIIEQLQTRTSARHHIGMPVDAVLVDSLENKLATGSRGLDSLGAWELQGRRRRSQAVRQGVGGYAGTQFRNNPRKLRLDENEELRRRTVRRLNDGRQGRITERKQASREMDWEVVIDGKRLTENPALNLHIHGARTHEMGREYLSLSASR